MSITETFDLAKKQYDSGCIESGYQIGGNTFKSYYSNDEWDQFIKTMKRDHEDIWDRFDKGDGGELKPYTNEDGKICPPKMASYASSSRFMYEQAITIEGFCVEKKLSTGLGGRMASLDGYLASKNLFIEAKCHEFYSHSRPILRKGHKALYDGIIPLLSNNFSYEPKDIGQRVNLYFDGDIYNFDLKQMLCHLCGIANMVLKNGFQRVNFIYLIYRPTDKLLEKISSKEVRERISDMFNNEITTAKRLPFNQIYLAILKYFNKKKDMYSDAELELFSNNLKFQVCDQTNFKDVVEHL